MATTNILQFDLSRKVNRLTLGSNTIANSYLGTNKVKEVYLGNKILYINDHKKIQLTTPVSNAYISETPISTNESYINIDLRFNNSVAYTYINFLAENNGYLTPTNYTLYTATTKNTAKTSSMPAVVLYTTGYMSSSNEQNYYAYLDVMSDVNTTTVLHRYHFKYHRLYSTGAPSTNNDVQFNVWNITHDKSCLMSFAFVFVDNNNKYYTMFSGGGSSSNFETTTDPYKRYRTSNIINNYGSLWLAYIDCASPYIEFYLNKTSLSNISNVTSCTTVERAANVVKTNYTSNLINISNKITTGGTRYEVNPSSRYLYNISSIMNFFVVTK